MRTVNLQHHTCCGEHSSLLEQGEKGTCMPVMTAASSDAVQMQLRVFIALAVPQLYNDHVENKWQRDILAPHKIHWEAAVRVFDDSYQHGKDNSPVTLKEGMTLGFMLAYCDADGGDREHFLGSHEITPVNGDKNLGYKHASVFGKVTLTK